MADVVVVGGGVIGSSIAYHIARQGRPVTVLELAAPATEPAASWASAGGVRRQGRDAAEALLAIEAIERWRSLSEELDADLRYRRDGNLKVGTSEADAKELAAFVRQQHALGLTDVRLVDATEARSIVPGVDERVVVGSYSLEDGHADPVATTRAFAAAAQRQGASYRHSTTVVSVLADAGRVTGVRTADGDILAGQTVIAAGAWSDTLAASVGVQLPIRTAALQMVLSTPAAAGTLLPVIGALNVALSLKQLPSGEFLLGGGWPGDVAPDRRSYSVRPESVAGNWAVACTLLPVVGDQQVARSWCGLEAISIDQIPFVGSVSGLTGLTIAAGFSGHGFAISPAVGRAVADQLAGRSTPELDGLSPDRIARFDREATARFLHEPVDRLTAG